MLAFLTGCKHSYFMDIAKIELGDIVQVDFNNAQNTLSTSATVLYIPVNTGDSWIFHDISKHKVFYVSEGCTITKNLKSQLL